MAGHAGRHSSPLVVTPYTESSASLPFDGRLIASVSDESGRNDVCAAAVSGKGHRTMVSIDVGTGPVWEFDVSADGQRFLLIRTDTQSCPGS